VLLVSGVVFVGVLWGVVVGESPLLSIVAGLVIILAVKLLWRPGEPPTLLLVASIHLLQVTTALFYANFSNVHINTLSGYGVDIEYATFVALGAVLCLILGMKVGHAGSALPSSVAAQKEARNWSPRDAFRFCLVTLGISLVFTQLSALSEGTRQLFLAGAGIQWLGLFLLAYVCLSQKSGLGFFLAAVALEVALGFTGFFGQFKEVFYVLFVAFAAAKPKLKFHTVAVLIFTALVALLFSAFWSSIKVEYREFLNKGSEAQEVLVPLEDRMEFLVSRVSEADTDTLINGFELLVKRMSYVEFFGATLKFVPDGRPHEFGAMSWAAVSHILVPRLFDPDKARLPSDTAVTLAYTSLPMTLRPGVSISIGYAGELYIDFGVFGMFACMGLIGLFYGKASAFIERKFSSVLLGYGASIALVMPGVLFETSLPKVLGAVCTSFIMLLFMSKFVLPFALNLLAWKSRGAIRRPGGGSTAQRSIDDSKGPL
jgi:hypothetical protein